MLAMFDNTYYTINSLVVDIKQFSLKNAPTTGPSFTCNAIHFKRIYTSNASYKFRTVGRMDIISVRFTATIIKVYGS